MHRATAGLKRLVVIGHTGSITLEAIRWLNDVEAVFLQIDEDGRLLASWVAAGEDQPQLRRAQASATESPVGSEIGYRLLRDKLHAQAANIGELPIEQSTAELAKAGVARALQRLETAADADELRGAEAEGAAAYWGAWSDMPMRFVQRDERNVPRHWLRFGSRTSGLKGGPRLAINPANAMLNSTCTLFLRPRPARAYGLDPGLGIFHVDKRYRDSLAADAMEPLRPVVDRYLLRLITTRSFGLRDFFETRAGVCRITPPLATELAETCVAWRQLARDVAVSIAAILSEDPKTSHARFKARAGLAQRRRPASPPRNIQRRCSVCGTPVSRPDNRTCSARCLELRRAARGREVGQRTHARMKHLRAEGRDPTKTPEALARLSSKQAQRRAEQREWDLTHPDKPDVAAYMRDIQPRLAYVSLSRMSAATGLSLRRAGEIKSGKSVPHARWWEMLDALAGEAGSSMSGISDR